MATAWYQVINTTKRYRLGTIKWQNGKAYIYACGVAGNVAGAWVHFDPAGVDAWIPVLAVADGQGKMGVSQSANTSATNYSWYQVYGRCSALCLASFDGTNGAGVWLTSTAGSVDDSDVAGDAVIGAIGLTDRDATLGTSTFELNWPFSVDGAID